MIDVITYASVRRCSVWATSEVRPRTLEDAWRVLYELIPNVLTRGSHADRIKKFCACSKKNRGLACEIESGRVWTFAKRVQRSQNVK